MILFGAAALAIVVAAVLRSWLPRVSTRPRARYTWWSVPAAALLGLGGAAVARGVHGTSDVMLAMVLAAVAGAAAVLFVVDIAEHRLPNSVIGVALALWFLGALGMAGATGRWGDLARSALGAAILFAVFLLLAVLSRGSLGYGDVKLSLVLGAVLGWFSWAALLVGVVIGVVLHGAVALAVLMVTHNLKSDVPMGPALIAGAVAAIAWGALGNAGVI